MQDLIEIQRSTHGDEEKLYTIHMAALRLICGKIYSHDQIEAICNGKTVSGYSKFISDSGDSTIYVATYQSTIHAWMHAKQGEIFGLFTEPEYTGRGYGKKLVEFAQENLKNDYGSITLEATLNAVPFYRKMGFFPMSGENTTRGGIAIPIVVMKYSS